MNNDSPQLVSRETLVSEGEQLTQAAGEGVKEARVQPSMHRRVDRQENCPPPRAVICFRWFEAHIGRRAESIPLWTEGAHTPWLMRHAQEHAGIPLSIIAVYVQR